jgi:hypothetical protein
MGIISDDLTLRHQVKSLLKGFAILDDIKHTRATKKMAVEKQILFYFALSMRSNQQRKNSIHLKKVKKDSGN